eukprot:EC796795.1.p1 GENE.EC796795.1~~EC796795.1.p1  ORF type:complete len:199 (+),score=50.17 EC796795.1:31-627(+)
MREKDRAFRRQRNEQGVSLTALVRRGVGRNVTRSKQLKEAKDRRWQTVMSYRKMVKKLEAETTGPDRGVAVYDHLRDEEQREDVHARVQQPEQPERQQQQQQPSRSRHFEKKTTTTARPNPFARALATAAQAKAERDADWAKQRAEAAEAAGKRHESEVRRRERRLQSLKKTRKGQPIMKHVINDLLARLQADGGDGK